MNNHFDFVFNRTQDKLNIEFDAYGIAWFEARQVAQILGYTHVPHMLRMVAPNESSVRQVDRTGTTGGNPNIVMINEYGLYRICLSATAQRPELEDFKHWVFYDVLPNIRMNGAYIDPAIRQMLNNNPNNVVGLNEKIDNQEQNASKIQLCTFIDKTRPPFNDYERLREFRVVNQSFVNVGQALFNSENNITLNQLAKVLSDTLKISFGEHTLRVILRDRGFLIKDNKNRNVPTQYSVDNGWMLLKYDMPNNSMYTVVTPMGLDYFLNYFKYYYPKLDGDNVDNG